MSPPRERRLETVAVILSGLANGAAVTDWPGLRGYIRVLRQIPLNMIPILKGIIAGHILGATADFERERIRERVLAGCGELGRRESPLGGRDSRFLSIDFSESATYRSVSRPSVLACRVQRSSAGVVKLNNPCWLDANDTG